MFFILSKDKIVSYILSFCMVMALLAIAFYTKDSQNTKSAVSNSLVQRYVNENK